MIAAREDAATECLASNQQINPGDGIFKVLVRLGREREKLLQRGEADMLHVNIWVRDPLELELGPEDQASQTEPTNRGLEKLRILGGRADHALPIGAQEFQAYNVATKGAPGMVIFAVNIVRDSSAYRDKFCAGTHRQKPAARNHHRQDLGQRDTGFTAEQATLFVKRNKTVQVTDI